MSCPVLYWRAILLITTLLTTVTSVAKAQGKQTLPGGLTMTETTLAPSYWVHGMIERRFLIENPSPQTQTVQLKYPAVTFASAGLANLSHTVLANAGTRTEIVYHQPPVATRGSDHYVNMTVGNHHPKQVSCQAISLQNKRYLTGFPINLLVSKGLSGEALKTCLMTVASRTKKRSSPLSGSDLKRLSTEQLTQRLFCHDLLRNFNTVRFEGEGSAWPQHWLAYSAFDGCLIAADDYARMSEGARCALRDYVAVGGHVTFMGMPTLPDGWLMPTALAKPPVSFRLGTSFGFGRACSLASVSPETLGTNTLMELSSDWVVATRPWFLPEDNIGATLAAIPVISNLRVPARSFICILLIFTLIAGPGVILFTRRADRRIWLLGLVPGFALFFSLAILGYALVSEGVTPAIRRQAITLLDQRQQRAATLGAIGIYAPVSLRDGLHFDLGTEITPLTPIQNGTIRVGRNQHYNTGWVKPRMVSCFRLRRSEMRSERLVVLAGKPGEIEVINALGAPIQLLRVCDAQGQTHETRNLAPGEKRRLDKSRARLPGASSLQDRIPLCNRNQTDTGWNIVTLTEELMKDNNKGVEPDPGSYVAVLAGTPFLENPLAYCRTKGSAQSVVLGWYDMK